MLNWTKVSDRAPPYDVPLLLRAKDKEYGFWRYCVGFNLCYPPDCNLRQNFDFFEFEERPENSELAFEVEEWIKLEIN